MTGGEPVLPDEAPRLFVMSAMFRHHAGPLCVYWSSALSRSVSIMSSAETPPSAVYHTAGWAR